MKIIRNGKLITVENKGVASVTIDESEQIIAFGGELKALDENGTIGGYAVIFSDEKTPDLLGDHFTKATDFFFEKEFEIPFVLYHHGLTKAIGTKRIAAKAVAKKDDIGIFVTAELDKADRYGKAILDMIKKKKLGYSTGSVPHLVHRKAIDGVEVEEGEITSWPIAELSVTPTPVEPRTTAVAMKAYLESLGESEDEFKSVETTIAPVTTSLHTRLNQYILDVDDSGRGRQGLIKAIASQCFAEEFQIEKILTGEAKPTLPQLKSFSRVLGIPYDILRDSIKPSGDVSVKGIYEDTLAEEEYKTWELWAAFCKVATKIANAAVSAPLAGAEVDWKKLVSESVSEYAARLETVLVNQLTDYLENADGEYRFYLRALDNPEAEDFVLARDMAIEDHCSMAVAAFKSVENRIQKNHMSRVNETGEGEMKAGRVLAEKHQNAFKNTLDKFAENLKAGYAFLESLKPKATTTEADAAKAISERNRLRAQRLRMET